VPYRRFIATCVLVTVSQSAVLAAVGMLSGKAYQSFAQYLGYFNIVAAIVLVLGLFWVYRSVTKAADD